MRRFQFDDDCVKIATYLQEWCDERNKLVLISYNCQPAGSTSWFDLKLEVFGYKTVFKSGGENISAVLNEGIDLDNYME